MEESATINDIKIGYNVRKVEKDDVLDDLSEEFHEPMAIIKENYQGCNKLSDKKESRRALVRQTVMVIFGNLGIISVGMSLGLPTVIKKLLTDTSKYAFLTQTQFSWFASLNLLAAPVGGILSSLLLDKFGRKFTMYIINIFGLLSWIIMATTTESNGILFVQLMISRFIIGMTLGLSSAPVGVYTAEISTPRYRGCLLLGTSVSVATGIALIYILGYFIRTNWHLIAAICGIYQFIALLCVIPIPESQNWLISKGRLTEAIRSLNYFRGLDRKSVITKAEILIEFNLLQKNIQMTDVKSKNLLWKSLNRPEVYKPLFILMGLFSFQQLTGIFIIVVYAVQISTEAGVTIDPFICAVMIGLARLVTTCLMGYILEKWGRRHAGILSATGMCICMVILALHDHTILDKIPYIPVIAIVCFIIFSTLGLYTLPYFMLSELFPQDIRGPASGLTVAFGCLISFICIVSYPAVKMAIGNNYCFAIFSITSFLALIFVYVALPETRGRTLFEIEENFRRKKSKKPHQIEMDKLDIN